MKFSIENPRPRLSWKQDEGTTGLLSFDGKPLSLFWGNVHDDNTTYLVSFPDCSAYREELEKAIEADLFTDYSYQEEKLHPQLGSLFKLLPDGEYKLHVSNEEDYVSFPAYPSSPDAPGSYHMDYFKFLIPQTPPLSKLSPIA